MLDERVERNRVEASKKAEHRQIRSHGPNAQAMSRHKKTKEGHADRAKRDESIFNFPARKIARGETPNSNPDPHGSLQVTDLRFVHAQHIVAVNDDHKLKQRG